MHVLHLMASGARGGGADHLLGLLPALQQLGVECSAAVGSDGPLGERLQELGVATWPLELMASRSHPAQVVQVARLVQRANPDLVHLHGTRAAFFAGLARPLWGRKPSTVYTAHGLAFRGDGPAWRRLLMRGAEWACCRADAVVSVSSTDLAELRAHGWLGGRLAAHVPNAVDLQRFDRADRAVARRLLNVDESAFVVGTTSRLVPQKAVNDLLDAALPLADCQVVVLGEGPERRHLARHPLVRSGRARLLGARDDVPACLPAFDVFALTSRWEGEPIALLEAMACALPCIATRTPGAVEILGAPGGGMLVDIGAVQRLRDGIAALRAAPAERRRLGEWGRSQVLARTYPRQAQRLARLYGELLPAAPTGQKLRQVG